MAATSASSAAAAAVAITVSPAILCQNANPRLSFSRLLPSSLRFDPLSPPTPLRISHQPRLHRPAIAISAVAVPFFVPSHPTSAVSTVLKLARPLPRILLASVQSITAAASRAAPTPEQLAALRAIFSAAIANRPPSGYFSNPLQALSTGAASCISLFAEILSVRCLLTWFPNIPWEKQPFSALRDLCDPYLFFCRKILPPVNGFDISPLLAFWVLGIISSLLSVNPPA